MAESCDGRCHSRAGCGEGPRLDRRHFIELAGLAAAIPAVAGTRLMAGPFEDNEYRQAIPADKKLDPQWVRSLYERGEKETYRDPAALARIGMPVGGLFAGAVYLSGDGRLWLWDVFNRDQEGVLPRSLTMNGQAMPGDFVRGGANFVHPAPVVQPFDLDFFLETGGKTHTLDARGFADIEFDGRYPIGRVSYRDPGLPVAVDLEAFSPFIPLNADDSSLPATILHYTVRNTGDRPIDVRLGGRMANPICLHSRATAAGVRRNDVVRRPQFVAVAYSANEVSTDGPAPQPRPDIRFEGFEAETYGEWTVAGEAFGAGPIAAADLPSYQDVQGVVGTRLVNSHATAPGDDIAGKDSHTGKLASREFTIERRFISLLVGGGSHAGKTCVNLYVDGKLAASVAGHDSNSLKRRSIPTHEYEGRRGKLEIVDDATGGWGNVGVDDIVFTDAPADAAELAELPDYGTMALALLAAAPAAAASAGPEGGDLASAPLTEDHLLGEVSQRFTLRPGQSQAVALVVAWRFPNFYARGCGGAKVGHRYAARHESAIAVVDYIAANFDRLAGDTRAWVDAWYDSTLPYWLLDRTMATASALATNTCYRFADGRFWAWEGVGCCEGTCTHVWHYAQAVGRLFPEVERDTRRRVDFGLAQHEDGGIGHRAALAGASFAADDGQAGRILGAYREHLMSPDGEFLQEVWPAVRRAIEYLIRKDGNDDGVIEDAQPNTLDAAWYGKVSFLASLYLAALRAGERMATEVGDAAFARRCRGLAERGATSILAMYDGEYFMHLVDPAHANEIGVGPGCYIDQVFGQTWAHWVGLGRLFDREKQLSALRALWKYNFVPDLGPFRQRFRPGRWYAMAGDAGLIMCSWPKGGKNPAFDDHWQAMYFNECMTGFEWQAAAHMIWEGIDQPDLLECGLAVSRAIHDRYSGALRNPYNEIECGDHYARSMASYGVFQAVCGFQVDGPRAHIEFAPRLSPEDFRAAFVGPEGWGTFEQKKTATGWEATLHVRRGRLVVASLALRLGGQCRQASVGGAPATLARHGDMLRVSLPDRATVSAGETLTVILQ